MQNSLTAEKERCQRCGKAPLCAGLGVVSHEVPFGHPEFGKIYRCPNIGPEEDAERQLRLRKISNLDAYESKRLDNFEVSRHGLGIYDNQTLKVAWENARKFAENPDGWLVFTGTYGCGKTHLAAAVGNRCLERGNVVLFVTAPDLLDHLRSAFGPFSEDDFDELFERIRDAQLLILDDLGTENPKAWANEKLFQLLNHRHSRKLPTVITTNVDIDSFDGSIRSRLLDDDIVRRFPISAPDYRTPKSLQEMQLTWPNDMHLENFDVLTGATESEQENLTKALVRVQEYANNPEKWLLLSGAFGTGKTHLAAAIAYAQNERGNRVAFTTVPDLMDWLRYSFDSSSPFTFQKRFQRVRESPLLVLDDMASGQETPWVKEKLFQLIDYRYLNQLPTVFTTAQKLHDLDKRIRSRLIDQRICHILAITSRSFAERIKRRGNTR